MPRPTQKQKTIKPRIAPKAAGLAAAKKSIKFRLPSALLAAAVLAIVGIAYVLLTNASTKPYSRLDCTYAKAYMGAKGDSNLEKKNACLDKSAEAMVAKIHTAIFGRDIAANQASYKKWSEVYIGLRKAPATEFANKLLTTPEAKSGYWKLSNGGKIDRLYLNLLGRSVDTKGREFWLNYLLRNKSSKTIAAFVSSPAVVAKQRPSVAASLATLPTTYRPEASPCKNGLNAAECKAFVQAVQRSKGERCKQYPLGGNTTPLCKPGSAGAVGDVLVERGIDGSNVNLNKAAADKFKAMRQAARREAGISIEAADELGGGYGSYRTQAMQTELVRRGYPAAPVGRSMHQWGLAIDFACNGKKFNSSGATCQNWIKRNAGRFGFYNLPSEPWHYSTNGK